MSSSMTELMPVLPDPVRRRRRYVLCFAILGNKQLYLSSRNNLLFTVLWSLTAPWSSEAVLFLNCGTRRCHGLCAVHWDPSFFESRIQVRLDMLLPPPTLSTFVEQIRDVTRSKTAPSPREISRRSEDSRDKADFCLRYFRLCPTDPSRPYQKYTAISR